MIGLEYWLGSFSFTWYPMHTKSIQKAVAATLVSGSLVLYSTVAVTQHVHGHVEIGIAIEEASVAVSIRAPLSDVIGFEHAPRNDEQDEIVRAAAVLLANADAMFGMPEAAGCAAGTPEIEGPDYLLARIEGRGAASEQGSADVDHSDHDHDEHEHGKHNHDGDDDEHDHSDHDHDEHEHDHADAEHADGHGHDHEGGDDGHSEVNATYVWTCDQTGTISAITASFAAGFEQLQEIEIQIVTATGARVIEADAQIETIPISFD